MTRRRPTGAATLILTREDVARLLPVGAALAAVERAFRLHADGRAAGPAVLSVAVEGGGFHVKAAGLPLSRPYFAAKLNANFPANPALHGLPTIQGVVALCDASNGLLLALIDSGELTARRTAAATALAARHLARENARVATICGCGAQAQAQLEAVRAVRPLERVWVYDLDQDRAGRFAAAARTALGIPIEVASSLAEALHDSAICITCTPSRRAFLGPELVQPGTFVAAVGADHPDKQEIEPALLARAKLVVDILEQAAAFGDLHHALLAGVLRPDQVHAELADVVSGRRAGRTSEQEIIVFDSTGTALQDVAAAAATYEKALESGRGVAVALSSGFVE